MIRGASTGGITVEESPTRQAFYPVGSLELLAFSLFKRLHAPIWWATESRSCQSLFTRPSEGRVILSGKTLALFDARRNADMKWPMFILSDQILRLAASVHPVSLIANSFASLDANFQAPSSASMRSEMRPAYHICRLALEGASVGGYRAHQTTLGRVDALLPPVFAARDRIISSTLQGRSSPAPHQVFTDYLNSKNIASLTICLMHECLLAAPLAGIYLGGILLLWAPCAVGAVVGGFFGAYQILFPDLENVRSPTSGSEFL